jgi:hypothetical protein
MEAQEAITSSGEAGYYSSPPSSPGNESFPSPFSNPDRTLSLGVYFSANEGENNDVIAALRASQRVIKETAEMIAVCPSHKPPQFIESFLFILTNVIL